MPSSHGFIVITDGGDNHSRCNLRETKELLEEADLPVFSVMAGPSYELPPILLPRQKKPSPFPIGIGPTPQLPNIPIPQKDDDFIGPAEQHGPENMKVLTDASGGAVFTAEHEIDLPRIVHTIGQAVRYRCVLTYKPSHQQVPKSKQGESASDRAQHKVYIELCPKVKFPGVSVSCYKDTYHDIK